MARLTAKKCEDDVTWEIRERPSLYNVLSVQGLQNLGAAEPLEATLHIVVIPLKRLCPQNPETGEENMMVSEKEQMPIFDYSTLATREHFYKIC